MLVNVTLLSSYILWIHFLWWWCFGCRSWRSTYFLHRWLYVSPILLNPSYRFTTEKQPKNKTIILRQQCSEKRNLPNLLLLKVVHTFVSGSLIDQYLLKGLDWIGCCLLENNPSVGYLKISDWKSALLYQEEHWPPLLCGASVCFLSGVYSPGSENRGPQVSQLSPSSDGLHIQFLDKPVICM